MFFVRVSLITKRLEILNQNSLKQFAYDWQYPIKKWFTLFAYRPPQKNDKYVFFNELNKILRKAVNSYKNINVIAEVTLSIFSCFFIFFMILAIFHPFQHFFFFFPKKCHLFFRTMSFVLVFPTISWNSKLLIDLYSQKGFQFSYVYSFC